MAKSKDAPVVNDAPVDNAPVEETPVVQEATADVTAPEKRKRGRPSNAEKAASAATAAGAAPVTDGGKPRGRPSKKSAKPSFDSDARLALANQVKGLHTLAAMGTGIPELNLADQEAIMLADAMANVAEQYGLSLGGKTGALIQMAAACALIYAPRFAALNERVKANKAKVVQGTDVTPHQEIRTDGAAATAH